jgi:hypothetical protein
MARRSKYTPDVADRIIAALESGATDEHASAIAGISPATFYSWQKTKPEFLERCQRAKPTGWIEDLNLIREAARAGDWRAAAEHLDRSASPYRKSIEITGKDGGPIVFDPGWMLIRAEIIAILTAHPEALADITEHLSQLEGGE